jgi:hypothetical protein
MTPHNHLGKGVHFDGFFLCQHDSHPAASPSQTSIEVLANVKFILKMNFIYASFVGWSAQTFDHSNIEKRNTHISFFIHHFFYNLHLKQNPSMEEIPRGREDVLKQHQELSWLLEIEDKEGRNKTPESIERDTDTFVGIIRTLVRENPKLIDVVKDFEGTKQDRLRFPLMNCASFNGNYRAMKELIAVGANVDKCSQGGNTPLWQAIEKGRPDLVKLVLDNGESL